MKKMLMESEEMMNRSDVAGFLRDLADKIESGRVTLKRGDKEVTLEIPDKLELEIEVEEKKKKGKPTKKELEIELEWYEGEQGSIELV